MSSLLRQMEDRIRQRMARKLPTWAQTDGILPPSSLALEQCSSETTAQFKASLVSGGRLVDLTGGYGVDCCLMSRRFHHTDYVERQPDLRCWVPPSRYTTPMRRVF